MPWETAARLQAAYGLSRRDADTLLSLDEYGGAGAAYFEAVAGDAATGTGRKACNWCVRGALTR